MAIRRKLHDARQGYRIYSQRLWFYPLFSLATALALYAFSTLLDRSLSLLAGSDSGTTILFIFTGGPDAARSLLGSVATAWTTILGVVFSLTAVMLQLASNKYTSELIPRIRRDTITQMTLSSLVGTVVYTLMVLSTVRTSSGPGGDFVPYVGVTLALVLAGISLLLTVTFIAHLSREVQGDFLTSGLARDGIAAMDRLRAPVERSGVSAVSPLEKAYKADLEFPATVGIREGYVQGVDWRPLIRALNHALERMPEGSVVRVDLERSVDDYLRRGDRLGRVVLEESSEETDKLGRELALWVRSVYEMSRQRTVQRDVYYAMEQLSDTGIKSSQTGDVDVVRGCVSGLTKLYAEISREEIPHAVRISHEGREAVISLRYQPLRQNVLRSLDRFFSRPLGMRYESAVEDFFRDTAHLILKLTGLQEKTRYGDSASQAERLTGSLELLLPALQKLYARLVCDYSDSELLTEGMRLWVTATGEVLASGDPRADELIRFLGICREASSEGEVAEVVADGLRSFESTARQRGDARLLATLAAYKDAGDLQSSGSEGQR